MSGVVSSVADFASDAWNNPHFQGGLQALGGVAETLVGGGMALGSAGIGAPVGGFVMAHGLDHFFTGLQTAFSGNPRNSVTHLLLQKTGMSSQAASIVDGGFSIAGSMGGVRLFEQVEWGLFQDFNQVLHLNHPHTFLKIH